MNSVHHRVQEVFREVFDNPTLQLGREMTAADVEGWDSLMHVELMIVLEKTFKIKFKSSEIIDLKAVGALLDLIQSKLNEHRA